MKKEVFGQGRRVHESVKKGFRKIYGVGPKKVKSMCEERGVLPGSYLSSFSASQ